MCCGCIRAYSRAISVSGFVLCLPLIFEGNAPEHDSFIHFISISRLESIIFPLNRWLFLGWAASWPIMRSRKSLEHWKKCIFMPIILHTEQFNGYFLSICNILSSEIAFLGLFPGLWEWKLAYLKTHSRWAVARVLKHILHAVWQLCLGSVVLEFNSCDMTAPAATSPSPVFLPFPRRRGRVWRASVSAPPTLSSCSLNSCPRKFGTARPQHKWLHVDRNITVILQIPNRLQLVCQTPAFAKRQSHSWMNSS